MPKAKKPAPTPEWICPFCQQSVAVDDQGFPCGDDPDERCLLPEHIVNGECVSLRDPRKARELLMDTD